MAGLIAREPLWDVESNRIDGWVIWDELGEYVDIGEAFVPASFHLRFRDNTAQPTLQLTFGVRDGVPACTGLSVESKDQVRAVMPKDLDVIRRELNNWTELAVTTVLAMKSGKSRRWSFVSRLLP